MAFDPEQIYALKQSLDLPAIAASSGEIRRAGKDWVMRCPFHADNRPSLYLYQNKSGAWAYRCFSCSEGGDVFDWIQALHGVRFAKALELAGGTVSDVITPASRLHKQVLGWLDAWADREWHYWSKRAHDLVLSKPRLEAFHYCDLFTALNRAPRSELARIYIRYRYVGALFPRPINANVILTTGRNPQDDKKAIRILGENKGLESLAEEAL